MLQKDLKLTQILFQGGEDAIYQTYCNSTETLDGRNICWLSKDYIWGFAGPVACVIIFNLYILFTGLKVANKVNLG